MHEPTYSSVQEFVDGSGYLASNLLWIEVSQAQTDVDNGKDFNEVIDGLYDLVDKRTA